MFSTGHGLKVDSIIASKLQELHASPRYGNDGSFIETDQTGRGFYLERGGIWNDTSGRASTGVTKTDLASVRSDLKKAGVVMSLDAVDGVMCRAVALTDNGSNEALAEMNKFAQMSKDYWKDARRVRVEKLRAAGMCTMCGNAMVTVGRSTCHGCGVKANARKKLRQAAAVAEAIAEAAR